ncbi:hypothetical protein B0A48_13535 [Cryoendolithus antarcticus]|uniref:Uncharacterized protein n=1 Tax=Cryoendolithus antarcticus TaxID=1507870 RepID=A0A1V8SP83_9PEZI|nr:hypothetical protein B0A48_13535 [Cryoendolithus antarcticus]
MSGRGGAGNIQAVHYEKDRIANDLESGSRTAAKERPTVVEVKHSDQQYAHSGRGGAGNYYSPKELSESGKFSTGDAASTASGSIASTQPVRKYGRGGAGNYESSGTVSVQAKPQDEAAEADRRARLQDDIEKGVSEQLAFPSKAKLPGVEPY